MICDMKKRTSRKSILDGYRVPGFQTLSRVKGRFGDQSALVVTLSRRQKKLFAAVAARFTELFTIADFVRHEISVPAAGACTLNLNFAVSIARFAGR